MPSKSAASTAMHAVGDTFDLMQKLWGMATGPTPANLATLARMPQRLPSMIAPTMDVDELDKRITDLRAVEQWLELNAGMLRTTIQTLEVQRATIATLKGIGGAMLAPMMGDRAEAARAPRSVPHVNPLPGVPPELMTPQPFAAALSARAKPSKKKRRARPAQPPRAIAADMPALGDEALNPTAWWQTLQDQFTRIAATAAETPAAALKATARASAKALKATAATAASAAARPDAAKAAATSAPRKTRPRKRARKA